MQTFAAEELPALFNEWMRRYTEEPEKFAAEFRFVGQFLAEQQEGKEPSYGHRCVGLLDRMRTEMAQSNT